MDGSSNGLEERWSEQSDGKVTGITISFTSSREDTLYWMVTSESDGGKILYCNLNVPDCVPSKLNSDVGSGARRLRNFKSHLYWLEYILPPMDVGGSYPRLLSYNPSQTSTSPNVIFIDTTVTLQSDFVIMHHSVQPGVFVGVCTYKIDHKEYAPTCTITNKIITIP